MGHNLSGVLPCPSMTPPPSSQLGDIMRFFLGSPFAVQYGNYLLTVRWSNEVVSVCILSLRNPTVLSEVQCLNITVCFFNCFGREGKCGPCHYILVQNEVSVSTIILGVSIMCQALGIPVFVEPLTKLQKG